MEFVGRVHRLVHPGARRLEVLGRHGGEERLHLVVEELGDVGRGTWPVIVQR